MPELPEVRTVVRDLKTKILNKKIIKINIYLDKLIKNVTPQIFKKELINKKIINVTNYGKFIIFWFSNNIFLVSHLRMEGKYRTIGKNNNHDHIIFIFEDKTNLYYNDSRQFGTFHLFMENPFNLLPLSKLANEPQKTNPNDLYKKLQRKRISIKTALLDQTILVGLGNIYVNEVLWDIKINPTTSCNVISKNQIIKILESSTRIMDHSTKLGGSSIDTYTSLDMKKGSYQNILKVHMKNNLKCLRCNEIIKKIKINGRGTYYCPKCQK